MTTEEQGRIYADKNTKKYESCFVRGHPIVFEIK